MPKTKKPEPVQEMIIRTDFSEIMQKSYIDYAMSVITARALPDVRDGLKPVQRRTLYDMYELGIRPDRPYRKSARIVGDTMGKYHPHGDSSIYESLVVMAQEFKRGAVLVDGHGNFGSIEGDGAAAMRYTEARLAPLTFDVFLADLDKDVVDFQPNFDETEREPSVLPVRVPNILVNGADGIAVGMATSIPPHNLGEIIDGMIAYIRDKDITTEELLTKIKGPDFPTGGLIVNKEDLPQIYETGTGKLRVRGRVAVEDLKGGKSAIVITEIPYTMIGSGIGKFMSDVAALSESKKAPDIADISNQSSKEGIRIVIELRKGANAENLINLLYKKTKLEDTFGVNMLAVAGGRPETLSLRRILEECVDFRFEVANRKYENMLSKERAKEEVQDGLIKACDVIDLIIEILRGSLDQKMAKACLTDGVTEGIKFKSAKSRKMAAQLRFTERQADAILNMRLARLIGLEVAALIREHEDTLRNIAHYENLLNNYDAMAADILADLERIRGAYSVKRRTELVTEGPAEYIEEAPAERALVFAMDRFGYAKTIEESLYEKNKDAVDEVSRFVFPVMSSGKIALFTESGKLHTVRVQDLPLGKIRDKGIPVDNVSYFETAKDTVVSVLPQQQIESSELIFVTKKGNVKRVAGAELVSANRMILSTKLADDDAVVFVAPSSEMDTVCLRTKENKFLRFAKNEIPVQKKNAAGVRGIKLTAKDEVETAYLLSNGESFQIEFSGRQVYLTRLKLAKRGGTGTKLR